MEYGSCSSNTNGIHPFSKIFEIITRNSSEYRLSIHMLHLSGFKLRSTFPSDMAKYGIEVEFVIWFEVESSHKKIRGFNITIVFLAFIVFIYFIEPRRAMPRKGGLSERNGCPVEMKCERWSLSSTILALLKSFCLFEQEVFNMLVLFEFCP